MHAAAYAILILMFAAVACAFYDHHLQARRRADREIVLRIIRYLDARPPSREGRA